VKENGDGMVVNTANRNSLLRQAEELLYQLPVERIQSAIDYMTYIKNYAEAEDAVLIESGILPRLIEEALQQAPSFDWEMELDAL
jgi:hypothetical protein